MASRNTVTKRSSRKQPNASAGKKPKAAVSSRLARSATRARTTDFHSATGIRIRMYRVGFGDFFLVSVPAGKGLKHILIDCGVHAKDTGSIVASVEQMAKETNHTLALVIVTHRHADHISGFARCKNIFQKFTVERVWMSWFENPHDDKAKGSQAKLTAAASCLEQALTSRGLSGDDRFQNMVANITGGGMNQAALDMVHSFANQPPVDYYAAGEAPSLPDSLIAAGLKATILGPPRDMSLIRTMSDSSQEYLAVAGYAAPVPMEPFDSGFRVASDSYRSASFTSVGKNVLEARVKAVQPDLLVAAAIEADRYLNNQSLVVLFTLKGKSMLFAGDAQWGNWSNFLYGGASSDELTKDSESILAKLDFYKVGHHGSRNATPKDAVKAMRDGCVAMCSTAENAYNDVPRSPLLAALQAKSGQQLARSDQVPLPDVPAIRESLPKIFKATTEGDCGYIDYFL
jgi:beta-lactamase superfamily II metal-dependent hydrolase